MRDKRTKRDLHGLDADGMVACNPRDREAAHRAEVEGIATDNLAAVTCKQCREVLFRAAREGRQTRPLKLDRSAESADKELPAFLARPEWAPVYHGFPILAEPEIEGFRLGEITDFQASPESGDAFIVAPDGSRAGLVWEVGSKNSVEEVMPFEAGRWDVWAVWLPRKMDTPENRSENLRALVALLRGKWKEWKRVFGDR